MKCMTNQKKSFVLCCYNFSNIEKNHVKDNKIVKNLQTHTLTNPWKIHAKMQ